MDMNPAKGNTPRYYWYIQRDGESHRAIITDQRGAVIWRSDPEDDYDLVYRAAGRELRRLIATGANHE